MKRISFALMSTMTVLVLLFGYRTSTSSMPASSETVAIGAPSPISTPSPTPTSDGSGSQPDSGTAGSAADSAPSPTAESSSTSGTVTGAAAQTRWGPVQVQLTLESGKITDVAVVQYPDNNRRDQEINAYALPVLVDETMSAQSADIDMVSGATYTSEGYLASLQSALDKAGI